MTEPVLRKQRVLFPMASLTTGVNGTFSPNHRRSIHRWYPYLEGFSAEFVQGAIDEFAEENCRIYDPFAGTGTTVITAAFNGHQPYYSEINPIMRLIIECKTNGLRSIARNVPELTAYFQQVVASALSNLPTDDEASLAQSTAFGERVYFQGRRLAEIVALKQSVARHGDNPIYQDMARLVLASIAVASSEMKRAADLRYRTPQEALPDLFSPIQCFEDKVVQVIDDIDPIFSELPATTCLAHSALDDPSYRSHIDLLITSPPYVNGTNYFRNTKLELWLTDFIASEKELGGYRDKALAAGINNISKRGRPPEKIDVVELVSRQLDEAAYDRRIPELVRRYFSDSQLWLQNAYTLLRPGATAVIDIGDSRYAGIHVPASTILLSIAKDVGFQEIESRLVRSRRAKDGSEVNQVLLVLRKPANGPYASGVPNNKSDHFFNAAIAFGKELPHLEQPFSKRNWGNRLHSLCSYQGKLKPAIAHCLVERFTSPGDRVLDPLSGCGTVPLESFLQGRIALGNDLQELAYILTKAKVQWGDVDGALEWQHGLLDYVKSEANHQSPDLYSDFGLNGKIPDYFHADTFCELLAARQFIQENPCDSWEQAIVYSCLLHILHGNRPYALSRRSHPVTPFRPTGPNEYRPLAPRLKDKVNRTLSVGIPKGTKRGAATLGSFTQLRFRQSVDVVITSPPFAQSTRFYSSNWMRLWFAGWEPCDFKVRPEDFLERQQKASLVVYEEFFEQCKRWLRPNGRLIMHVGRTAKCNMAEELGRIAGEWFEVVYSFDEDVAGREKFGIRDQGATTSHQYIFMRTRH